MDGGSTVVSAETDEKTRAREGEERGKRTVIHENKSYAILNEGGSQVQTVPIEFRKY